MSLSRSAHGTLISLLFMFDMRMCALWSWWRLCPQLRMFRRLLIVFTSLRSRSSSNMVRGLSAAAGGPHISWSPRRPRTMFGSNYGEGVMGHLLVPSRNLTPRQMWISKTMTPFKPTWIAECRPTVTQLTERNIVIINDDTMDDVISHNDYHNDYLQPWLSCLVTADHYWHAWRESGGMQPSQIPCAKFDWPCMHICRVTTTTIFFSKLKYKSGHWILMCQWGPWSFLL